MSNGTPPIDVRLRDLIASVTKIRDDAQVVGKQAMRDGNVVGGATALYFAGSLTEALDAAE